MHTGTKRNSHTILGFWTKVLEIAVPQTHSGVHRCAFEGEEVYWMNHVQAVSDGQRQRPLCRGLFSNDINLRAFFVLLGLRHWSPQPSKICFRLPRFKPSHSGSFWWAAPKPSMYGFSKDINLTHFRESENAGYASARNLVAKARAKLWPRKQRETWKNEASSFKDKFGRESGGKEDFRWLNERQNNMCGRASTVKADTKVNVSIKPHNCVFPRHIEQCQRPPSSECLG